MRVLWRILTAWSLLIFIGFGIRIASILWSKRSAAEFMEQTTRIPAKRFEVETYNYLRGDYRVVLKAPPFRELSWTVNLLTNQVISWQSQKKEDSVLRSLL